MKYLIVGLGNIGEEYDNTRHNIGFMILDSIAKENNLRFTNDRLAFVSEMKFKGRTFYFIKPTTYMNLSGKAIKYWLTTLKIEKENCLVVLDDLALPLGTLRMKIKGSDGGHNGLKSIDAELGNNIYPRLRFGIGSDFSKGKQVNYVLGKFKPNEETIIHPKIQKSIEMIFGFGTVGIDRTMTKFNE
jgi:PTH1 family peptidyl-tRNA hydrolase